MLNSWLFICWLENLIYSHFVNNEFLGLYGLNIYWILQEKTKIIISFVLGTLCKLKYELTVMIMKLLYRVAILLKKKKINCPRGLVIILQHLVVHETNC